VRHDRSTSQRRARVARRRDGRRDRRGLTASGSDPCPTSEHAQHGPTARVGAGNDRCPTSEHAQHARVASVDVYRAAAWARRPGRAPTSGRVASSSVTRPVQGFGSSTRGGWSTTRRATGSRACYRPSTRSCPASAKAFLALAADKPLATFTRA
jgi:hypothetical protein